MIILIPAYKPDERLVELNKILINEGYKVVVVDDGSGSEYDDIFGALDGAGVVRYDVNKGKGRAMKTGFEYILRNLKEEPGVITADADGQHIPTDIARISEELLRRKNRVIIGSREFRGEIPLRSRLGNSVTRVVFAIASGIRLEDTQTGLRGIPMCYIKDMILLSGERYEYEMNMLMFIAKHRIPMREVFIETVYLDDNASSHFNAVKDSIKIYKVIIKAMLKR